MSDDPVFDIRDLAVSYDGRTVLRDVTFQVEKNEVTAIIGPSGCGKSTFIRCLNRMNDVVAGAKVSGTILYNGQNLYGRGVDAVEVRKRIGMVFQRANPFPKSIYDNVAYGPRSLRMRGNLDERVQGALQKAALWDEVKDRLKRSALSPLRRPAAAPLHRARARRGARRDPHGRAGLRARPDRDDADRGSDARAEGDVHDRDRHAQHAAGRARRRQDRFLQRRA